MTEEQGAQLLALSQQLLTSQQDAASATHALMGVEQFIAHLLQGVFFLLLIFGTVVCSQLRRSGGS